MEPQSQLGLRSERWPGNCFVDRSYSLSAWSHLNRGVAKGCNAASVTRADLQGGTCVVLRRMNTRSKHCAGRSQSIIECVRLILVGLIRLCAFYRGAYESQPV
jgi:hypothetical protein